MLINNANKSFGETVQNLFSKQVSSSKAEGSSNQDDYYQLIKHNLFGDDVGLTDDKKFLEDLVDEWRIQAPNLELEESQRKLNIELLNSIIKDFNALNYDSYSNLHAFLQSNRDDKDLKAVLNLKRGELGTTLLHVFLDNSTVTHAFLQAGADPNAQDNKGNVPLHDAVHYGCEYKELDYLLKAGANPNIQNHEGKTPQQTAFDSSSYSIMEYFFTESQEKLKKELCALLEDTCHISEEDWISTILNEQGVKNLKEFLDKHKGNEDLKIVLNIKDGEGKPRVLGKAMFTEVKDLIVNAGATTSQVETKEVEDKPFCLQYQLIKLDEFLDKVLKAKDMAELQKVTINAIVSGVRLNFAKEGNYFTDYVIKKISELEKNPNVASDIICQLISRGARLQCKSSEEVLDRLVLEYKGHKANVIKAHETYINRAQKFLEAAKNATNSKLLDARMDNATFELQYSGDSKIDVARIIDGAKNAGLTQGSIEYGRNIIKIGESEVEVETQNGRRNYTGLSDNSSFTVTFHTNLGELNVKVYHNPKQYNQVQVEVEDKEKWNELQKTGEVVGKGCLFGGKSLEKAVEDGCFMRSGRIMPSEMISQSKNVINDETPYSELESVKIQAKDESKAR